MNATIASRIADVQGRIAEAAQRAGRDPASILLVAVSKTYGLEMVQAAAEAGVRHFGENRVEEAVGKIPAAHSVLPDGVIWHMIGHIQSRKTAEIPPLFNWIHSVDRLKIARRLSDSAADRVLDILLEINISGEESKSGYLLAGWPDQPAGFEGLCRDLTAIVQGCDGVRVQGLMTMAPYSDNAEDARPIFRRLCLLRDRLRERFPELALPHLSMGMTADYEVAVEEGATMVRVGTAIFGRRDGV